MHGHVRPPRHLPQQADADASSDVPPSPSSALPSFPPHCQAAAPPIDEEHLDPFVLYGTVSKKYFIERLDVPTPKDGLLEAGGGDAHVLGRRRGFTATACVTAVVSARGTIGGRGGGGGGGGGTFAALRRAPCRHPRTPSTFSAFVIPA